MQAVDIMSALKMRLRTSPAMAPTTRCQDVRSRLSEFDIRKNHGIESLMCNEWESCATCISVPCGSNICDRVRRQESNGRLQRPHRDLRCDVRAPYGEQSERLSRQSIGTKKGWGSMSESANCIKHRYGPHPLKNESSIVRQEGLRRCARTIRRIRT
jgi:hypothetical protein